jgi:hypothetical protein
MMYERLSDTDKIQYSSRMTSWTERQELREKYDWEPGTDRTSRSSSSDSSGDGAGMPGGLVAGGAVAVTAFAAIELSPGALVAIKATAITLGIAALKVGAIVALTGVVVYNVVKLLSESES